MADDLTLRLHERVVGTLRPGRDPSRVRLVLAPDFDAAEFTLSESFTALPDDEPPSDIVSNFLGGYVPEGYHRTVMASQRGIDAGDLFALLREFGGSMAGALTIRSSGADDATAPQGRLEDLTEAALGERLRQALRETNQAIPDDSRSTLPGFQPKVLVNRAGSAWTQPHGSAHSTHILKPQVPQRASRLIDEHYGHLLAEASGLSSYTSELLEADGVVFLAIERFDRRTLPSGEVTCVHQEDLAQALGLDWRTPDAKFQDPHWPDNPARASAARVAQLLATNPGGSSLVGDWVRRMVFSVVLGDNDAHAKNIALMHTVEGTVLAPAYDTVPGLFGRDLIDEGFRLAFAINGSFDHRKMGVEALVGEVQSWNVIGPALADNAVEQALNDISGAVRRVTPPEGISDGLAEKLVWTIDRLESGDAIGTAPWQDGS